MKVAVGVQIIADLYGVDEELISDANRLYPVFEGAIKHGRLTEISSDYYQFQPKGASGVVLLAESHLSFHTWPEHGLVTLDIYTCGDPESADIAFNYIVSLLRPESVDYKKLNRGVKVEENVKVIRPQQIAIS
ncbi:MAG: S-adenosylmethionine decarboxylase [Thermoplasmatales archaeon B_DKE]|nr:MAG: S-adenosylmethionine decarboxylase [Thermoplasmatales archaeon B_DKE]QRF76266.1 S-adenosylmethionine decarboxylase proenzyme precursor [Thermoplasmatales archaeon]